MASRFGCRSVSMFDTRLNLTERHHSHTCFPARNALVTIKSAIMMSKMRVGCDLLLLSVQVLTLITVVKPANALVPLCPEILLTIMAWDSGGRSRFTIARQVFVPAIGHIMIRQTCDLGGIYICFVISSLVG